MKITVDGKALGKTYRGAGMVSGNGSSRLLLDYKYEQPEKYREILELIFGEKGIGVTHLKLEMGSDINSSSGTEPCVKRYGTESADVTRGAGYILACDAKKINPGLTLDMLFWSEPKWVTDSEDVYAARFGWYYETLVSAYGTYGLEFDFLSISRNERDIDPEWIKYFSRRLRSEKDTPYGFSRIKIVAADEENAWNIADIMMSDSEVRDAVDIIGSHYTSFSTDNAKTLADKYGKELWFSEGSPPMTYGRGLARFGKSPLAGENGVLDIVTRIAAMYSCGGMTMYQYQPVVSAYYDGVCYCHKCLIDAAEPWSGHYTPEGGFYAAQMMGAFFKKGWRFIDSACLCDGEKEGHTVKNSVHCALAAMSGGGDEYSLMLVNSTENDISYEPTFENVCCKELHIYGLEGFGGFEKKGIYRGGEIRVKPFSVTVISTILTSAAVCGESSSRILELPYSDDFCRDNNRNVPRYMTDQGGAFEFKCIDGENVLMQMITPDTKAMEWGATPAPTTNFGDDRWYNYNVTAKCHFEKSNDPGGNYVGVGARFSLACTGMSGYSLWVYENGGWEFYRGSEILLDGKADAQSGDLTVGIFCENENISGTLNGRILFEYAENLLERAGISGGRAALYSSYSKNYFKSVNVSPVGGRPYIERFNNTDECFSYEGDWEHNLMSGFADHKRTVSSGGAGSRFSVRFNGRGFGLFGANEGCEISVFLDGRAAGEKIKLPKSGNREIFYRLGCTEPGSHTFSAEVVSGRLNIGGIEVIA